jgi:replication factor A1
LIGRVLSLGPIRSYTNLRGDGHLCELFAVDAARDVIRLTLFGAAVDRFHAAVAPRGTFRFSSGRIKLAAFDSAGAYEVTFGAGATIHAAAAGMEVSVDPSISLTNLADISTSTPAAPLNLAGVVHAVGNLKRTTTARGKRLEKREFALVDDSNTKAFCTTWGMLALECSDDYSGHAVVILGARVSDYNGSRSINVGFGASLLLDPSMAVSGRLSAWYTVLPQHHKFTTLGG